MRIGIITHYYKSLNYGGVLQAYALCRYLSEQGYEAQQICYDRSKDPPFWGCRLFKIMGRPLLKVIRKKQKKKAYRMNRENGFRNGKKQFPSSDRTLYRIQSKSIRQKIYKNQTGSLIYLLWEATRYGILMLFAMHIYLIL